MPISRLLYVGDETTFGFDHANDHRPWIGVWENERTGFTSIPYQIDQPDTPMWRLNHQQAHWDTLNQPPRPIGPFSAPTVQNFLMSGPTSNDQVWWTFANHAEHYLVAQTIAASDWDFYYPFY